MEKKNLTIRVSDDEREWLEKEAKAQCRSTGNFIRYILSLYRENQNGISPLCYVQELENKEKEKF